MSCRKWTKADFDGVERPIESLSDLMACVREVFEENKRYFCFWSSLAMVVFLYLLLFVVD